MSGADNGDRPISAAEAADLRRAFEELQHSYAELAEASTERERRDARSGAADAREDLDELAERFGISRSALNESIAAAKRAERRDELRPIIAELLEEARAAEEPPEPPVVEPPVVDLPVADDPPKPPKPPKEDADPVRPHWSQRGVSELLR